MIKKLRSSGDAKAEVSVEVAAFEPEALAERKTLWKCSSRNRLGRRGNKMACPLRPGAKPCEKMARVAPHRKDLCSPWKPVLQDAPSFFPFETHQTVSRCLRNPTGGGETL